MIRQSAVDDDTSELGWNPAAAGALAANLVQQILLVTDGTVTNIVEAYAGEPITVVKLRQSTEPAGNAAAALDIAETDQVLHREVLLTGKESGRTFVYALSQIVLSRLDRSMRRSLLESVKPIGRLLEENRVQTFREILGARREPADGRGTHFGVGPRDPLISRTYRIIAGGGPLMLITEKFPATAFAVGQDRT